MGEGGVVAAIARTVSIGVNHRFFGVLKRFLIVLKRVKEIIPFLTELVISGIDFLEVVWGGFEGGVKGADLLKGFFE